MKAINRRSIVIAMALVLMSPSTPSLAQTTYGPRNFWGGYWEKQLTPGVWQIKAMTNGHSGSGHFSAAMAEYRAGELFKSKGFDYIRILSGRALSACFGARSTHHCWGVPGPGDATLIVRGAKGADDSDGCMMPPKRATCETLEIDPLLASLSPVIEPRRRHVSL